jgi:hypothetical protein
MSVPPAQAVPPARAAPEPCAACGAPLAHDQRYCLHCGEVRPAARRELPAGLLRRESLLETELDRTVPLGERRPSTATALAGLACLLLAMGVGVLIGRGASGDPPAAPITIAGAPAAAAAAGNAAAATPAAAFASDWQGGAKSWTIALDTLPKDSTQPADVAAAKAAATGKGAKAVGALDSDDYATLTGGSYVVYAGQYPTKSAATKALAPLKADFDGASVVHVGQAQSSGSAAASTGAKDSTAKSAGDAKDATNTKQAFEQSKKAPTTVVTKGKPPPKDNKPAANGAGFEEIG